MALSDLIHQVEMQFRDSADKIGPDDQEAAALAAVISYSKVRPRSLVKDVTSAGGQLLDLPEGWDESSTITTIEYPVGDFPPTMLQNNEWLLYQTPTGPKIMLSAGAAAGSSVRVTFTVPHIVDDTQDTTPVLDREAISFLAAANLCDQLATMYSGDQDSTISADSVNHISKASEYAKRAAALRRRYFDELGIDPKRNVASGVVVRMKGTDSAGRTRLTHNGRRPL